MTTAPNISPAEGRKMVESRLRSAWRQEQRFHHIRGLSRLAVWIIGMVMLDLLVDWLFIFKLSAPEFGRWILLAINLGVLGWVAWWEWLRHLRKFDPVRMALRVEHRHPELSSLLVTYVQMDDASVSQMHYSPQMLEAMRRQALQTSRPINFREIVDFKQLRRLLLIALVVVGLFSLFSVRWNDYLKVLALRMAGIEQQYPTQTQIVEPIDPGDTHVRRGDEVTVIAQAAGRTPGMGALYIRAEGEGKWQQLELAQGENHRYSRTINEVYDSLEYYVRIGDDQSRVYTIETVSSPRIAETRVAIDPPDYMEEDTTVSDQLGLNVPAGSTIRWNLAVEPAVRHVTLQTDLPADEQPTLEVVDDGSTIRFQAAATQDFRYALQFTDKAYGFEFEDVQHMVRVVPDRVPDVELLRPDRNVPVTTGYVLPLRVTARDDHGLGEVFIVWSVDGGMEQSKSIGTMEGEQDELTVDLPLSRTIENIAVDQVVSIWVAVADRRGDDAEYRGRSTSRRLSVVTPAEWTRWFNEQIGQNRQELNRLRQEERQSLGQVERLKKEQPPENGANGDANAPTMP